MTDEQIIKGLECIGREAIECAECAYGEYCYPTCHEVAGRDALDLINRQKAEIERLKTKSFKQQLKKELHRLTVEEIKAEAIKDFAEKLKELYTGEIITDDMHCSVAVIKANIDDIAKEMIGEQE